MKKSIFPLAALFCLLLTAMGACNSNSFKVEGTISDARDSLLLLERSDFHGAWIIVDSTRIGKSGNFSFSAEAPASPEIYRLSLGRRTVYFPVDSTESITVNSSLKNFDTGFSLSGSENAKLLEKFEKELLKERAKTQDPAQMADFKRRVFTEYLQPSKGSIVGYYILTKTIDNKPLFDPFGSDYKYIAAVATSFKTFRPDDPHTDMLEQISLDAMRKRSSEKGLKNVIQAEELKVIEISLPDENGQITNLSSLVGNGRPTVVVFSLMLAEDSPQFNRLLAEVRNKLGGNVNIYQVSLDSDIHAWRQAAANLPWTTVIDQGGVSNAITSYNVNSLPAFYIYNAAGDLIDSTNDITQLASKVR